MIGEVKAIALNFALSRAVHQGTSRSWQSHCHALTSWKLCSSSTRPGVHHRSRSERGEGDNMSATETWYPFERRILTRSATDIRLSSDDPDSGYIINNFLFDVWWWRVTSLIRRHLRLVSSRRRVITRASSTKPITHDAVPPPTLPDHMYMSEAREFQTFGWQLDSKRWSVGNEDASSRVRHRVLIKYLRHAGLLTSQIFRK